MEHIVGRKIKLMMKEGAPVIHRGQMHEELDLVDNSAYPVSFEEFGDGRCMARVHDAGYTYLIEVDLTPEDLKPVEMFRTYYSVPDYYQYDKVSKEFSMKTVFITTDHAVELGKINLTWTGFVVAYNLMEPKLETSDVRCRLVNYETALRFYAKESNYRLSDCVLRDQGDVAREALDN